MDRRAFFRCLPAAPVALVAAASAGTANAGDDHLANVKRALIDVAADGPHGNEQPFKSVTRCFAVLADAINDLHRRVG